MNEFEQIFYNNLTFLSRKWTTYFKVYERHLAKYKGKNPTILEIGVAHGGSTEMWRKYFGECNLYAIDCDPKTLEFAKPLNVDITIGDQEDPNFWAKYLQDKPEFDIILDDGGHTMQQQLNTMINCFQKLKVGGTMLVEDTHTSYWKPWGGEFKNPQTFIENTKNLVDLLHRNYIKEISPPPILETIFKDLWAISYYNSIVVLEKDTYEVPVEAISNINIKK